MLLIHYFRWECRAYKCGDSFTNVIGLVTCKWCLKRIRREVDHGMR